jgi:2-polyprenyl-3-methyl-5-hydroxy-6-metoxy-1,4-benzoquinol methylase
VRILVAIANHGTKNRRFLDRLLHAYREMPHDVDVVVLSDAPKALGGDVEVRVGAPTDNPWSLPFAHRKLFAERSEDYDLYIYSEDDTLIEAQHVETFVELNGLLPEDEVPGFLRFEEYPDGDRSYCSVHSAYRWLPDSVAVHGGEVFASFSNEHSACYILTRHQLHRAIASGEFLVAPHEGRYDMLVSAATDPYVRCGLRRRLCITRIDEVLLHHLPNVYLDQLGINEPEFRAQIDALVAISRGELQPVSLLDSVWRSSNGEWEVPQYPGRSAELAALVGSADRVLSFGCTSGRLERESFGPAATIVGIPIDEVMGSVARLRGLQTTSPVLEEAFTGLEGARFDTVLVHHVLRYVAEPSRLLGDLAGYLKPEGVLVLAVPNSRKAELRRLLRQAVPGSLPPVGGHETTTRQLRRWTEEAGLRIDVIRGTRGPRVARAIGDRARVLDRWLGDELWVAARSS